MGQSPVENAIAAGDVEALLAIHRAQFGGFRMEADEDAGSEDDGAEDAGDGEDGEDGDGDDVDADGPAKGKKLDPKTKALHDENSRRRNENKQLREDQAKLAKKLKEYEDADKSETEKITGERDDLRTRVETLSGDNTKLRLKVAFLENSTQSWHNPKAALKLLEIDGVEIDEDGQVVGMDKAIEKLAKDNPFLVKGKDEDKDESSASGAPSAASGQPVGSKKEAAQRAALEKKYRLG